MGGGSPKQTSMSGRKKLGAADVGDGRDQSKIMGEESEYVVNDEMMNNLMKMKKQYPYLSWTFDQREIEAFCAMLPYH